jgi:amino acid adenylation domain-containing protein
MHNSTQGFRLSPQQKSLWLRQQHDSAQPYRAVCAILLEGDLQPRVLEQALYSVVQRHEILRTTFQRPAGIKTPFQVVSDNAHPNWQAVDLSHLDSAHQNHRIEASLAEERARPFDFELGTLLRVRAFKLSAHRRMKIVSLPALCADSVTLTNFVKALSDAYERILDGQEIPSEAGEAGSPMQYVDFAEWQNELLEAGDEHAVQGKAYWEEQTTSAVAAPVLPFEKPAKLVPRATPPPSFSPATIPVVIDWTLRERLETLAKDHGAAIATLLFASWQALIWRLTGQSDFLVFNLSDGRKLDDLKGALGLYAAYLPVRCHCEDVPFAELLRAGEVIDEGREWHEYFECSGSPAAQIAFEFVERPVQFMTSGVSFSLIKQEVCHQPFKLKLSCVSSGQEFTAELQYDTRVFDRETVERFAGYWQRFLVAQTSVCVSLPDAKPPTKSQTEVYATPGTIGAVDILGAAERRWLLSDLNRTETEFPNANAKCIHELFEEQVVRTPQAIALVFGAVELTYEQLNARANQLAHLLADRGVSANDRVGLSLPRGAEMIVGLLGILKAGGAYVPLNPDHPTERLAKQLVESDAAILITNAGQVKQTLNFAGETIDLDLHGELPADQSHANPSLPTTPDNLAYVIYTSGSTGVAKGVAVQHRNLVNYTNFILQRLGIGPGKGAPLHFALVSTIAADLGNTCIFPSLVSGGCLHILSYDAAMDGGVFRNYVAEHPIDVLKIVPSHFQALLASEPDGAILPSKFLLFGGEALSWELSERVSRLEHTCRVINHYGPTETTVGSLTGDVDAAKDAALTLTVPIGLPIANTRAYVLDKNLQPQPLGVAGELYIGGAGVAAGYLNQAGETAARFVADPFSAERGARLYRTGDMVRCLLDGNVEFLGRADNQIKVRGFRVELGEIEAVLATHPAVRQAVVAPGTPGTPGTAGILPASSVTATQHLVAYIVSSTAKPPSPDELRDFLKPHLPDYMIPSVFVSLSALPLTPNGKIDRAALPAPEDGRPDLQKAFVAPRSDTEMELAGIWSTFLNVSEVGVHDNFFDLGGHSLLATQVVSRMRQAFQTDIPLASIFQAPTVAALAEKIDSARTNDTERLLAELEQLSDDEAERLLRAQGGE